MTDAKHLRFKRKASTVFLLVEPSDTFGKLRTKLGEILGKSPDDVKIIGEDKETELPDAALLSDHEIEDDSVLYFVFSTDGGGWESVDITPFDEDAEADA